MKKLALIFCVALWVVACSFPEKHSESGNFTIDEEQMRLLTMSEEEFVQRAKQEDPQFRRDLEKLDSSEIKKDEFIKSRNEKDEELRQLVKTANVKKRQEQLRNQAQEEAGGTEEQKNPEAEMLYPK